MRFPTVTLLLVLSLVINPVMDIANSNTEMTDLDREVATQPCHQMKAHSASGADSDNSTPESNPDVCPFCDKDICIANKSCQQCPGGGHACMLLTAPPGFVDIDPRQILTALSNPLVEIDFKPPLQPPQIPPSS